MSVRVLRSPAGEPNPKVVEMPRLAGEDNAAWLKRAVDGRRVETGPDWSLLLLVGGNDPLSFRLRVAQSQVRHDLSPSAWSHVAFIRELGSTLAAAKTVEVSLAPAGPFGDYGFAPPSNGIQEGRLGAYLSRTDFPNIAILSAPVPAASIAKSLEALKSQRSILDVPQLILRWLGFCWGAGVPANPLVEGLGFPSAAVLEVAFAEHQLDLTPGLESRSSCPEAIWQAASWWHPFYERTASGHRAMRGAYTAKHDLVPDGRYGGSPERVTVTAPPARKGRARRRRR